MFSPHHHLFELFKHCTAHWECLFPSAGLGHLSFEVNVSLIWDWKIKDWARLFSPFLNSSFLLAKTSFEKDFLNFQKPLLWKITAVNSGILLISSELLYVYVWVEKKNVPNTKKERIDWIGKAMNAKKRGLVLVN